MYIQYDENPKTRGGPALRRDFQISGVVSLSPREIRSTDLVTLANNRRRLKRLLQASATLRLRLSSIEAHFYRRQHAKCASDALKCLPEAAAGDNGGSGDRALGTEE
eukprot:9499079-Pyramimonas_sp.AAC.1